LFYKPLGTLLVALDQLNSANVTFVYLMCNSF
jgi:hypothetical protein